MNMAENGFLTVKHSFALYAKEKTHPDKIAHILQEFAAPWKIPL